MRITVEWQDVVDGESCEAGKCAIAKAFNRLYPHYTSVRVGKESISFSDKGVRTRYQVATPLPARKFIEQFDKLGHADPGLEFSVRLDEALTIPMGDTAARRVQQREYVSRRDGGLARPKPRRDLRRSS